MNKNISTMKNMERRKIIAIKSTSVNKSILLSLVHLKISSVYVTFLDHFILGEKNHFIQNKT